jgi:hypothetical protein
MCLNRSQVDVFLDALESFVEQVDITGKAQSIYMLMRVDCSVVSYPIKLQLREVMNTEKGVTVTVMACCSAIQKFILPFVIFKGKRMEPEFSDAVPPAAIVRVSENGYINLELFSFWLQHFKMH